MKRFLHFPLGLIPFLGFINAEPTLPLVPLPAQVTPGKGTFLLETGTAIVASKPGEIRAAEMLGAWLRPSTGLPLAVVRTDGGKAIRFSLDASLGAELGREGYRLKCHPGGALIEAATDAGLIEGVQTFRQLLPPQAFRGSKVDGIPWTAAAVDIKDRPRCNWRGFMIDVSRHFLTLDDLKRLVDDMSAQKLNLLQIHLTDDDGWRVEIKKYPKLTEIGAWRGTACKLPNTRNGETFQRYGGFYTQDELRSLVAYAKARNVEIMPEIDLPGHSLAIVTAYPETLPGKLSDAVSAQGHSANAISPAKEANYRMIDDIIAEIASIFPFPYIHIGGDEVNHKVWDACPEIKGLMEKEKLGNLHQVQVYFTQRLETILTKRGKRMIGWQEISDGRLSRETGIMAWIGPDAGWNAAKRGAPAVLAPGGNCYFDMGCPGGEDEPPSHWWAGKVSLSRAYEFDPLPTAAGLSDEAKRNVLGVQAALWTEFVTPWKSKNGWLELRNEGECAEYKIWPRLCATAEIGWTPQSSRDYPGFIARMAGQYARMAEAGRKFRLEPPTARLAKGSIVIVPPWPGAQVRFTTDGSDPFDSPSSRTWDGSLIDARHRSGLAMRTVMPGHGILSPLARGAEVEPAGAWDVADWTPGQARVISYQVGDHISTAGRWKVRLVRTKGSDGLEVDRMELRGAGKILAKGSAASGGFVLEIADRPEGDIELSVTARFTHDKRDAKGQVTIEKLPDIEVPGIVVETGVPCYGAAHDTTRLLDGDPETFYWSSRNLEAGETVTWILPEPTSLKSVELQSGQPGGTKDQILDAVLEVSDDGVGFRKAAGFNYGAAKAELGGARLKAIRLRATAKSPGWVILQDLVLRR